MSVDSLIAALSAKGVELWFEGSRLRFRAPKGALSAEQRAQMAENRDAMVASLRSAARARTRVAPLSYSQRSLWFLNQELPESPAYNVAFVARVRSAVDLAALQQALQALVDRHAALRTTYGLVEDVPRQFIAGDAPVAFDRHDCAGEDEQALRGRVTEFYSRHFDLARGPVFRAGLFTTAPDRHVLIMVVHHIAADGWSLLQLVEELRALYSEAARGTPSGLGRPGAEYTDFVTWQEEVLAGAEGGRAAGFWLDALKSPRAVLELPTDRRRAPAAVPRGANFPFEIDEQLSRDLRQLARDEGTTLFVVLMAAYKSLLHRLAGAADVLVGTPTFGRSRPEFARVIGDFVNTIVLRSEVDGSVPFRRFLAHVKKAHADALAAQDYPLQLLVERLQPSRSAGRSTLFETMFVLQRFDQLRELEPILAPSGPAQSIDFGGLTLEHYALDQQEGQFDLTLQVVDRSGSLAAQFKYDLNLFDPATVQRFAAHFQRLLHAVAADPSTCIDSLPLLEAAEREALLSTAGTIRSPNADCRPLHERFEEQAAQRPDAIAVGTPERRLTYRELNERANRLAHRLIQAGVGPDGLVGLRMDRTLDLAVGLLAILKAGGAYLPIDLTYPADRVAFMLADSRASVLLTKSALRDEGPEFAGTVVLLDDDHGALPVSNPPSRVTADNLIYAIYTSGSTGKPKGTLLTHRAVDRLFSATAHWFAFDEHDVWTMFHSVAFDFSVWEIWGAWRHGGRLLIVPHWVSRAPDSFLELLREERVTVLNQTPSAFRQLLQAELAQSEARPTSLRFVIFGGEALELQSLRPWFARHGDSTPTLVNMYGITETCVHVTYRPIRLADLDAGRGSVIGEPIPDLRVHVLDSRREPQPIGVVGEMYVGGPGLALGYLNRPELTAERFVDDPFAAGERLYRSGDLARRLPEGDLEYLGRIDQQVKIRGFRIELGEIESAIAQCGFVRQCAVLDRDDAHGSRQIVAFVVIDEAPDQVQQRLRESLKQVLPDYMVPSAFVVLPSLPLTSNGKTDRRALLALGATAIQSERVVEPPRTAAEQAIAAIWCELLGLQAVGRTDNFFELGGHSLLVVTLLERLRRSGYRADVRGIFLNPVLESLASTIDAAVGSDQPDFTGYELPSACERIEPSMLPLAGLNQADIDAIVANVPGGVSNVQDILPLMSWQEGVLFHRLMLAPDEEDPYIVSGILQFSDRDLLTGFLSGLQSAIDRHDALRTSIHWKGLDRPVQVVYRRAVLRVDDLAYGKAMRIDLTSAPLMIVQVIEGQDSDSVRIRLSIHHIVIDHISMDIVLHEIGETMRRGSVSVPQPVPLQALLARALRYDQSKADSFFAEMLAGVEEPTCPFGLTDAQSAGKYMRESVGVLSIEVSRAIRKCSMTAGVGPAVFFHVVWSLVLAACSGRRDVVFGTVLAGRSQGHEGSRRAVGMFINTLPLRVLIDERCVSSVLREVYHRLSMLAVHEQSSLVRALQQTKLTASTPLFTALLNYRQSSEAELAAADHGRSELLPGVRVLEGRERTNYPFVGAVDDRGRTFSIGIQCADFVDPAPVLAAFVAAAESLARALGEGAQSEPPLFQLLDVVRRPLVAQSLALAANVVTESPAGVIDHRGFILQFEARARSDGAAVAVSCEGSSLTYRELNARANRVARRLRDLGVGPGVLVGLCMERSPDLLVALLGIHKSCGAYVPLDPHFPRERLAYMLEDSGACVLVTAGSAAEAAQVPEAVQVLDLDEQRAMLEGLEAGNLEPQGTAADPAYVIYTSGSTGRPKGVAVSHGALANFLGSMAREPGLQAQDVLAAVTTISFDIAALELYLPLQVGARIELIPREVSVDGAALAEVLESSAATVLQATPATWRMLVESGWRPKRALKALCGGEALPRDLADALLKRVSELWNLYGPTETTVWSTLARVAASPEPITVGRPIANTRIYVLDEARQPTPIGVPGEIWIGGAGVALGYHQRPELTAERFAADPFASEDGARMYRTGDLGRWDAQGRLHHLGRLDQQVKIRGYRIELGEIEAVLAAHPAVRQAVVNPWRVGPGDLRLVAYVVLAMADVEPDAAALRAHLGTTLPEYMIPAIFVMLAKLPLTPNGKVDRKALPMPDGSAVSIDAQAFAAPRTETERALAEIWSEVLQTQAVGIDDNFFARGGHSLLVARVAARIRSRLGHDIGLRVLFDLPTIRGLARKLDGLSIGDRSSDAIPMAVRPTRPPLSFAQQRLWYFHQLVLGSALFNLPVVLTLTGTLDLAALESSFRAVLARHEALRTILPEEGDQPFQLISAEPNVRIQHTAIHADDGSASDSRLVAAIREEVGQPFDLANGALVRARLFRVRDRCHVLAVTMHHAISDGVSISVFVRDWAEFYRAAMMREPARLPPLPIQYVDYAIWQREWLSDERLRRQLDFWRRTLEKAPPYIELPIDHPRPAAQTYRGALSQRRVDGAIRERLDDLSRRANTSLFVALFSAFVHLLGRHSGQDDISVGVAIAGRGHAEVENLVGLFINTLVLRTKLDSRLCYEALLRQVRKVALDAFEHQDLPFERLVEELQPPRDLARTPLFQVLFNMLDLGMPEKLQLPGLEVSPYEDDGAIEVQAKFDLTIYAQDRQGTLSITAVYNADLFAPERIEEFLDQYLLLLERASASSSVALSGIELATSRTSRLPDPHAPLQSQWLGSIQGRFAEHARRSPNKVAVVDASTSTTYAQIHELSNALAQYLIAEGVERQDRVAIHADRHVGLVVSLLAALKAGAAFMVLDPAYPAARRAAMLELAQPKAWIDLTNESLPEALEQWLRDQQGLVRVKWHDDGSSSSGHWRHATRVDPLDASGPDDLVYLVFTSGSTGVPKAIAGTHAPLSHFFQWHQDTWNLTQDDRFSVLSGLAHDPLLRDVLGALWVGATVLMPDARQITEPGYLAEWLRRERATVVHLTPQMADLASTGTADGCTVPLPDLRHVYFGGDVLTGRTVAAVRQLAPRAEIVNYYGASETPQAVGFYKLSEEDGANPAQRLPLGRGIADVQLLVLNEAGAIAAIGELGEICVRTPYLARGYFGDGELTASRFAPYPFDGEPPVPMYRTGDLGRFRPDGEVEYHGRRDSQVKIRGFRVELGEVVAAIRCHPDVVEAAAIVRAIGSDDCRLVGYYTTRSRTLLAVGDLQAFLRARLPDHMVPTAFVGLERLPLTPNGKLDVARLPLPSRIEAGQRTAPRTDAEVLIADIWREVLGVADLCIEDNFFEVGGHSLTATRVLSRLRARANLDIPLKTLFEFPTIGSLAKRLDESAGGAGRRGGSTVEELVF